MAKEYIPPEKKKRKNWGAIIFLFFLVIGLSSSFVFFGFGDENKKKLGKTTFNYRGDHWEAKVNGQIAAFSFSPEQISAAKLPDEVGALLSGKLQIDTTSDQNDTLKGAIAQAQYQMGLTLASYNSYLRVGYDTNSSQFPTITCEQATPFVPVISFTFSNETKASLEGSCVIAEAKDAAEMILLKDRLLFSILQIG